jgi:hypothetical protein
LNLLHENTKIETIDEKEKNDPEITDLFNRVEPEDLYTSIMAKKKELNESERQRMFEEANRHQEDASTIKRMPECKYHKEGRCYRKNPVHKLAHTFGHPASLVAFSMIRDFSSHKNQ